MSFKVHPNLAVVAIFSPSKSFGNFCRGPHSENLCEFLLNLCQQFTLKFCLMSGRFTSSTQKTKNRNRYNQVPP